MVNLKIVDATDKIVNLIKILALTRSRSKIKPQFDIGVKDGPRATLNPISIHEAKLAVQIQKKSGLKSSMQLNGVSLTTKGVMKIWKQACFHLSKTGTTKPACFFEYLV